MSTSFFLKQNTLSRRKIIFGGCAAIGTLLFPSTGGSMSPRPRLSFVDSHVQHAHEIIREEQYAAILQNPYLASALYYSDRFLARVAQPVHQVDVPSIIIGRIQPLLSTQFRQRAYEFWTSFSGLESSGPDVVRLPLDRFSFGHGQNHADAVDLFTREGTAVRAHTDGLVLLADRNWQNGNVYSAASLRGGNTVIVFDSSRREFTRYAHLRDVEVAVGQTVIAGQRIGTVGNTGTNAIRPGHGGHLHFEINQYRVDTSANSALSAHEIRRRLQSLL